MHCYAALGLEQPFNCLVIQNRQAMRSMRRSVDWKVKDDMANGLFYATLTSHRRGHTPFVQAGEETSDTGAETIKPRCLSRTIPGGWVPVWRVKVRSLVMLSNHSAFHRWSAQFAALLLLSSVVVRRVQTGVSIWDVRSHAVDRRALSGADVQVPWHGVLEAVWLLNGCSTSWRSSHILSASVATGVSGTQHQIVTLQFHMS